MTIGFGSSAPAPHAPVMLKEVIAALEPSAGDVFIDATLGAGGYARAMLDAGVRVLGFDRDPTAIARASNWSRPYGDQFTAIHAPFGDLEDELRRLDAPLLDGAAFDLGVSSMQFDEPERGFSFRAEGPLSMRMDGGRPNAADVVNQASAEDLAAVLKLFGEERFAGRIARAIVAARSEAPIETTVRLSEIVEAAQPKGPPNRIHPATRTFQALRIFVNDELGQLARALSACERALAPGGRLVVVTFHSLEDRIVKRFIAAHAGGAGGRGSRHAPIAVAAEPSFEPLYKKPITPSETEVAANPRARSAKLRAARRTSAAPLRVDPSAFYSPPRAPDLDTYWSN
ncbi:MAG: 16S rRNA (cytosine(1402)-N(4))-methyltransferase RsmH [Pseudomonadota bacterium]